MCTHEKGRKEERHCSNGHSKLTLQIRKNSMHQDTLFDVCCTSQFSRGVEKDGVLCCRPGTPVPSWVELGRAGESYEDSWRVTESHPELWRYTESYGDVWRVMTLW